MKRLRILLVIAFAIALIVVLLEWTLTSLDPLRISRFEDFRTLAVCSGESDGRPTLVRGFQQRLRDGLADVEPDGTGERLGLAIEGEPGRGQVVVIGSGLAFGYGVRAGQCFVVEACRDLGLGLSVHAHPFVLRTEFDEMIEGVEFDPEARGPKVLVLVDRMRDGLSERLRRIRDGHERRGTIESLLPAISQVASLVVGSVQDERGTEQPMPPIDIAMVALKSKAALLGAIPVYVDTGADPEAERHCELYGLERIGLVEGGVRLHPLSGFPDGPMHAAMAVVFERRLREILDAGSNR